MERFLLINNQSFFDKHGIYTVNLGNKNDIPHKSCILFIGSHTSGGNFLNHLVSYFPAISRLPQYTYIILLGKSDKRIPPTLRAIPKNVKFIYANNINYTHPKIKYLPMGSDFRSISSFPYANMLNEKRPILCYCNFSLNTHSDRRDIFQYLKPKPFITFENMGNFMQYSISRDTFFKRLTNSKFTICPRGNALDTFRFFDVLYAGSIPIIVKESFHNDPRFNNLPILFLNKKEDYLQLSRRFLLNKYAELSAKKRSYYPELDFNVFINNLKTTIF